MFLEFSGLMRWGSHQVKHYKNLPFVDLQPKGGKLPLNGDIYIAIYDADFGSKDDKMCSLWLNTHFIDPSKPWLLEKANIHLSKDNYIALVDDQLAHILHHLGLPPLHPGSALDERGALHLYCKVYAAPVQHGPRLRKAAGRADLDIVRDLVGRGCDLNTADGNGHTPLHTCAFLGVKEAVVELAALSGKNGGAKLVVDAKDNRGWTPLMCAASNGHVDVCKVGQAIPRRSERPLL